jgi:Zn-dependent protease/CBS domain-containing protein
MQETFRLGRIAGVRVGVNWSVLVIFVLIAYGLAGQYFPRAYPHSSAAADAAAGILAAIVFVFSLLAHELAHAVVARRNGVPVEGITLWLFGGVARLSGEAQTPGAELRIAGVGPLVSLLLGLLFGLVAGLLAANGVSGLVVAAFGWLGGINVSLAVFNVIPAAPLDGGRLLRALVWRLSRDRRKATIVASRAGQVFGWLLVAYGLFSTFVTRSYTGLWSALIGWFLVSAATVEAQQAGTHSALAGVPVARVMSPASPVPGSVSVAGFLAHHLPDYRHSAVPVSDEGGNIIGLVTLDRIGRVPPADRGRVTLRQLVCPVGQVATARPDEPVTEVLGRMRSGCGEGRALVLADGELVGVISPEDVMRALQWARLVSGHATAARH